MNTQTFSYSQSQDKPQSTSNSVFFNDQPRSTQDRSEKKKHFPIITKITRIKTIIQIDPLII